MGKRCKAYMLFGAAIGFVFLLTAIYLVSIGKVLQAELLFFFDNLVRLKGFNESTSFKVNAVASLISFLLLLDYAIKTL